MSSEQPDPPPDETRPVGHTCHCAHQCAAVAEQVPQILGIHEVAEMVGLGDSTIYRLEAAGRFPKRLRLSPNRVGWLKSEAVEWIRAKERKRT